MENPLWAEPGPPQTCSTCVWRFRGGRGPAVDRCRRHRDARVLLDWPACPAWEAAVDCQTCGACCREAYHAVEVSRRDPFVRAHPALVTIEDGRAHVARRGERCAALNGEPGAWSCAVYADRPATCRAFEAASDNCLIARRRVGLTR